MKERRKVKITVVRKLDSKEIFGDHMPEFTDNFKTTCPLWEEGKEFLLEEEELGVSVVGMCMPRDFCSWAWHDIHRDLTVQQWGGDSPLVKKTGVVYTCCTNGLRPVIFQLERIL